MAETLFDRLGGEDGIRQIASDLVDIHLQNPAINHRYIDSDVDKVKHGAATFFITGTGGPNVYEGKDMVGTHRGMNISNDEFMAVLDDVIAALQKNNMPQRVQEEVLYIFFSMKSEVVGQ